MEPKQERDPREGKMLLLGSTGIMGTALEIICRRKGIPCIFLAHKDFEITERNGLRRIIEQHAPATVLNAVVFMGINPCEENPEKAFAVNATAVMALAQICEEQQATLVQFSSHAVFDGRKNDYYTEDDSPVLTGIYSASKYLSECFARNFCTRHYIVRFPTLFGFRRSGPPGFVDKVVRRIQNRQEVQIASDKLDSPTYSRDAAEAVLGLVEERRPYGIYHVANAGRVSYYDFAVRLAQMLDPDTKILKAKDADFPSLGFKPLKTALKSVKLQPLRPWQEALQDYLKEIRQ